jgi:WD40 repeat protein
MFRWSLRTYVAFILTLCAWMNFYFSRPWREIETRPGGVVFPEWEYLEYTPDKARKVRRDNGRAEIVSIISGKVLNVLAVGSERCLFAEFSPDGNFVSTTNDDSKFRIWNAASGQLVSVIHHTPECTLLLAAFSPDNSKVVVSSGDTIARVFNVSTGIELAALGPHQSNVDAAVFSVDGHYIATMDGTPHYIPRFWEYRYPDKWWGCVFSFEFWLAIVCSLGLTFVVYLNRRATPQAS